MPDTKPAGNAEERVELKDLSAEKVRAQLARITGSPEFEAPERARSFLRYVVEEALAGRGERIKGYTIAVEAADATVRRRLITSASTSTRCRSRSLIVTQLNHDLPAHAHGRGE